jgi:hypothetical protein
MRLNSEPAAFQSHALDRVQRVSCANSYASGRGLPTPTAALEGIVRGAIADDSVAASLRRQRERGLPYDGSIIRIAAS